MDYTARAKQLAAQVDTEFADLPESQALALAGIYAQLAVAEQAKRIADALEAEQDYRPERGRDGRYRITSIEDEDI